MKTYLTFLQLSKLLKVTKGIHVFQHGRVVWAREFKSGSPALNSNESSFFHSSVMHDWSSSRQLEFLSLLCLFEILLSY